jgi:hypothetical protein
MEKTTERILINQKTIMEALSSLIDAVGTEDHVMKTASTHRQRRITTAISQTESVLLKGK